jgi:hypothetical protein
MIQQAIRAKQNCVDEIYTCRVLAVVKVNTTNFWKETPETLSPDVAALATT